MAAGRDHRGTREEPANNKKFDANNQRLGGGVGGMREGRRLFDRTWPNK